MIALATKDDETSRILRIMQQSHSEYNALGYLFALTDLTSIPS